MDQPRRIYTEGQIRQIVHMAARDDEARYSAEDLRVIGREIDISEAALERAIAALPNYREPSVASFGRTASWCGTAGVVARSDGGKGRIRGLIEFQAKNLMLWGGYAFGWGVLAVGRHEDWFDRFGEEQVMFTLVLAGLTAVGGGLVSLLRTPTDTGTSAGARSWRVRWANRLKGWVDRILLEWRSLRFTPAVVTCDAARNPWQ